MFGEELEFGAVTFRMLPWVVIADLSWRTDQKKSYSYWQTLCQRSRPGLCVFLHATLHRLGWPWFWWFPVSWSCPGSPSLMHQPLLREHASLQTLCLLWCWMCHHTWRVLHLSASMCVIPDHSDEIVTDNLIYSIFFHTLSQVLEVKEYYAICSHSPNFRPVLKSICLARGTYQTDGVEIMTEQRSWTESGAATTFLIRICHLALPWRMWAASMAASEALHRSLPW